MRVAALFVDRRGPYWNRDDVDAWDIERDARKYDGPWPVVAHPPCERWGRYWSGGPSARVRRTLGDDGGCFEAALASVRKWGGVLEHPEASHAFRKYNLEIPGKSGHWIRSDALMFNGTYHGMNAWTCCVEQGHYGHKSRKATWLYLVTKDVPPSLVWGKSEGIRLDEGFHSRAERLAARAAGIKPIERLAKNERHITPPAFAELLLSLARKARAASEAA